MKRAICSLPAIFALAFTFMLATSPAKACGLDEILMGVCPVTEVEYDYFSNTPGTVTVYAEEYAWSNYSEFKGQHDAPIVLKVCVFRGLALPVQTVAEYASVDYSGPSQAVAFKRLVGKIETAATKWTDVQINNKVSRLQFAFRDTNGDYRECERFPDSHILISINDNKMNYSEVGFRNLKTALALSPVRSTMSLEPRVLPREITHEFGHALGFLHEMAHESWKECANAFNIEAFMKGRKSSTPPDIVEKNIVNAADLFNLVTYLPGESFDRRSIMVYKILPKHFDATKLQTLTARDCSFNAWPRELSDTDQRTFAALYSKDP